MVEAAINLDRATETMRDPLRDFAGLVRQVAGERARSLTLFGAIVGSGFQPRRQTARSVLVLDRVELPVLRRLAEHGARLGKASIAAPLIMTPEYIDRSRDTFPLEFIEIQQHHATVFGEDAFDALSFEDVHVRHQCERELKVILIGLRQGLLAAAGREKVASAVERDVAEGLLRTIRGMLWLKGQKEGKAASDVITEMEKLIDRKLTAVRVALDPVGPHGWDRFDALYRDVEALGEIVDGW